MLYERYEINNTLNISCLEYKIIFKKICNGILSISVCDIEGFFLFFRIKGETCTIAYGQSEHAIEDFVFNFYANRREDR